MLELAAGPATCDHGLTVSNFYGRKVGCEVCAKGPIESTSDWLVKASRPDGKPKARKDPDVELAANVAAGLVCPSCLTPYDPIGGIERHRREREVRIPLGCECQRLLQHEQHMEMVDHWLQKPEVMAELGGTAIAGHAFTSYNRSARRAAIAPDDRVMDRLDIIERHEVDPRWTPLRVNEADTLPV